MNNFKQQLIELYRQGFNESDEYTDYFFRYRYKEENIAYTERGGRIISALHLIPQRIMIEGSPRNAGFVSSAATLPEYRGKGVFFETMDKAYGMLEERGMGFCVLYPFKHEYYRKHGFIEYSYVTKRVAGAGVEKSVAGPERKYTALEYAPGDRKLFNCIKEVYEKACFSFEGWVVRDDKEWEYRLNEAGADGGIVLVIKSDNNLVGYAFVSRGRIEECCFTDFAAGEQSEGYLIDCVKELAGMEYTAPLKKALKNAPFIENAAPFGMIKKTGCTAEQTFEFFKEKSCFLLDRY